MKRRGHKKEERIKRGGEKKEVRKKMKGEKGGKGKEWEKDASNGPGPSTWYSSWL